MAAKKKMPKKKERKIRTDLTGRTNLTPEEIIRGLLPPGHPGKKKKKGKK